MIRSMTGFGSAVAEANYKTITVDIKSVNSKFFDLSLRLPAAYKDKDMELRTELARELERGKIDISFNILAPEEPRKTSIDHAMLKSYYKELKAVNDELNLNTTDYLNIIFRLPEVLNVEAKEYDEKEWKLLTSVLGKALKAFQKFREKEGKVLENDMRERIRVIESLLKGIEKLEPMRLESLRKKLSLGLEEFIQANNIDRNRFEQELIFYIEKVDISEEKVRLRSHCEFFLKTISEPNGNGKKLTFISQEIGREINTIGSKANDAGIQKMVVEMKDELEKIKEQLMNVL